MKPLFVIDIPCDQIEIYPSEIKIYKHKINEKGKLDRTLVDSFLIPYEKPKKARSAFVSRAVQLKSASNAGQNNPRN